MPSFYSSEIFRGDFCYWKLWWVPSLTGVTLEFNFENLEPRSLTILFITGNCDNCVRPEGVQYRNFSEEAHLLMTAIKACGGRFGLGVPIDVLRGSMVCFSGSTRKSFFLSCLGGFQYRYPCFIYKTEIVIHVSVFFMESSWTFKFVSNWVMRGWHLIWLHDHHTFDLVQRARIDIFSHVLAHLTVVYL